MQALLMEPEVRIAFFGIIRHRGQSLLPDSWAPARWLRVSASRP
jgi:hypothetical protein